MTHYTNTSNPVDFPQSKIIELWGEALDRGASETYTQMSYSQVLKVKDVFAELIVRECAKALWTEECNTSDLALEEFEKNRNKILQHFGVEE